MAKFTKSSLDRRKFLKGAAAGGVATLLTGTGTLAAKAAVPAQQASAPILPQESDPTGHVEVLTTDRPGGDFMVDVLKAMGIEYVAANPGSSFRGLHESIINYGGNKMPEFLTCCHEEASVALAHGYAKIEGKPMGVLLHSNVGLQHASMAIYNAYCDRVPVFLMAGNTLDAAMRRPGAEWYHSMVDPGAIVRDCVKWDDQPVSLVHFAESAVRAYRISMTPPQMPVLLALDSELQERPVEGANPRVPKLTLPAPPQGDSGAVAEAARLLVAAENPLIIVERSARTPAGIARLIELAEALQAPVIDIGARMNFPTRHPLNQSLAGRALTSNADVILGLELGDFWGAVNSYRDQLHRTSQRITRDGAKLISINAGDLFLKANNQDFQRSPEVDLAIAADSEATLPALTEAVKRLITDDRRRAFQTRGARLAETHRRALERVRTEATYGWNASPITTARLAAEVWAQIKDQDWSLVSDTNFMGRWPLRLWSMDKHYQYIGRSGGAGQGYGGPATVGAAIANQKYGRLSVGFQGDGDLMYSPGILWTAAHHKVPLLSVMLNNRAYHQEVMHLQRMAARHQRGIDRAHIGTTIDNPNIDYAKLGQSMGVYGEGPITDPQQLGPAVRRALEVVKKGEPALIDVVIEPR